MRVGRFDGLHEILRLGRKREATRPIDAPGKSEVIRRQREAVVPGEPAAQPIGRLHHAVREDVPGIRVELRHPLGEDRTRLRVAVDHSETRVEGPLDVFRRPRGLRKAGRERRGLKAAHVAQRGGRRRPRGHALRAGRAFRLGTGAGENQQRGEDDDRRQPSHGGASS